MKILLSGIVCATCSLSWAQQSSVSSGGDASGSGGTASYSVGQVSYINETGLNDNTNQGVQQGYDFKLGLNDNFIGQIQIYPNPTSDYIILTIEDPNQVDSYSLYDSKGSLLSNDNIKSSETSIDMKDVSAGQYTLLLHTIDKQIQTINVIKH